MNVTDKYFRYKKVNYEKLKEFGFKEERGVFSLETPVCDGQMVMKTTIRGGEISANVYDPETGDEYTLHTVETSSGEFVGKVRAEFESVLSDLSSRCCETEIFKREQTKQIIAHIRAKYGDELEFLWDGLPDAAIWRRKDNGKWYGLIMCIKREKLGAGEGLEEVIDVRALPQEIDAVVDGKTFFRGYHMNKKNWLTFCLDGSVDFEEICKKIENSYNLAGRKK